MFSLSLALAFGRETSKCFTIDSMRTLYASGCFRILRSLGKDGGEMGCSVTRRGVRTDSSPLPLPPSLDRLESAQDTAHARHWLMRFKSHKIPKDSVEITFSRSSGPGGQVCPHRPRSRSRLYSHKGIERKQSQH